MTETVLRALDLLPFFVATYGTLILFGTLWYALAIMSTQKSFSLGALVANIFPPRFYFSRSGFIDLMFYLLDKLTGFVQRYVTLVISTFAMAALFSPLLRNLPIAEKGVEPGAIVLGACLLIYFCWKEFVDFLVHYWFHKIPCLWELHKVHHSATSLIPLTSLRGNPVEKIIVFNLRAVLSSIPLVIICFVVDVDIVVFAGYAALFNKAVTVFTLDPLRHSHLPINLGILDRIFISPHMHQVHHSKLEHHWDKNFATNLAIFDWMFGTAYRPENGEVIRYGIGTDEEDAEYQTVRGALVSPVVKTWLKLIERKPELQPAVEEARS